MKDEIFKDEDLDRLLTEYIPKANLLLDELEEERDKDVESHVFSKQYQKNIKKIIKEYRRPPIKWEIIKSIKYIAASLIAVILVNGVITASAEVYRETVIKKVIKSHTTQSQTTIKAEKGDMSIIFIKGTSLEEAVTIELYFIEPSYIPEGFESISDTHNNIHRKIEYLNGDKSIVYIQSVLGKQENIIYRNDLSTKKKKISDKTIYYSEDKGIYKISWNDKYFNYFIIADVSFEELIKIIEGI